MCRLLNSSSPYWDAQAEQGGVHRHIRALLPGRRPAPALALLPQGALSASETWQEFEYMMEQPRGASGMING